VTDRLVAESSAGHVEIEFGVDRWVMVTIDSLERQQQLRSERALRRYLVGRGLFPNEAEDIAHRAWDARPRNAAGHLPPEPPNWTELGPTTWRDLAIILVVLAAAIVLLMYLMTR
jgi:hypothetical protein